MARLCRLGLLLCLAALLAAGCGADDEETATDPRAEGPPATLGCDGGEGRLILEPQTAGAGGEVSVGVENLTEDRLLTYGLANELERAEGEEWVAVELPSRAIIEIALLVKPGETAGGGAGASRDRLELPAGLEPGSYRIVKQVSAGEPSGGGATESLTLCAPLEVGG